MPFRLKVLLLVAVASTNLNAKPWPVLRTGATVLLGGGSYFTLTGELKWAPILREGQHWSLQMQAGAALAKVAGTTSLFVLLDGALVLMRHLGASWGLGVGPGMQWWLYGTGQKYFAPHGEIRRKAGKSTYLVLGYSPVFTTPTLTQYFYADIEWRL